MGCDVKFFIEAKVAAGSRALEGLCMGENLPGNVMGDVLVL